jgi:hypothetical protein
MNVRIEEAGTRLRQVAREWGVPQWDSATPSRLRAHIAEAYQREIEADMRRRAVAAARRRHAESAA